MKKISPILISTLLLLPVVALAVEFQNPLQYDTFEELINAIINFIFTIALAIAPLMIIIAAFYFVTAGGDPKKVDTAQKIILYTCIGLVVILMAKGLIVLLKQIFQIRE